MASTADFRNGLVIHYNNDLYSIVEFLHVKPGKGPAFVRTKLKSLTSGKVVDNTFNSGVKVQTARVENRPHQYLYKDDMGYTFMDNETFEQVIIQEDLIEGAGFMKDGEQVSILFHAEEERPLTVELPAHVVLEITYTEPGVKGDTATNATKPATLETGHEINVPLFINQGEKVKVDTRKGTYMERVK
ncbi:MAG TPA: elongation factor P [Cytophagales bacterium]|nr:elongation factor P [Cytophagales bacterium]HAA23674.1 elongation factor P [Cytophagales bacterium]HAP59250.1 elongation factor P [Cytophagales bacterium]